MPAKNIVEFNEPTRYDVDLFSEAGKLHHLPTFSLLDIETFSKRGGRPLTL